MTGTPAPAETATPVAAPPPKASGWAARLYRGEAGLDVVGRRRILFGVAGTVLLVALLSFGLRGFTLGIDFRGGTEFQVPASATTLDGAQSAIAHAVTAVDPHASVVSAQRLGGDHPSYLVRTSPMTANETAAVKSAVEGTLHLPASQIGDNRVSAAWGSQVTQRSLLGLGIFLILVIGYLVIRFEWRMAVAAVSSLAFDLVFAAAVYSLVGWEVSPNTVIGALTILGFALYDVVVVFDKIQENTRGITTRASQTYGEAANLAVNQMLMRSINTGLVALLPVGGLLFIGAGLLGAGTLKDLGLVLFVGMGAAVYSSIFFATPVLVSLKQRQPQLRAHARRVASRRRAAVTREAPADAVSDAVQKAPARSAAGRPAPAGARGSKARAGGAAARGRRR
ncbi:protein translocase subunit SecF [Rugosimonospora africana]|uniref:Protein-export membrane protein SecF n=1 Tax=Rugosimonospora africana TaxID=556532 RepID=A0A8J3QTX5_9ACTN|nr:protein translocase subunit SecF [Rugosimonospora africana]GIH15740.1 protein translocase subunit SecF [Rugosimonospora africana]